MLMPRRWVRLRRAVASVGGYFWLPCRCCGQLYGGHETGHRHIDEGGHSWTCCRWCNHCAGAAAEQEDIALYLDLLNVTVPDGVPVHVMGLPSHRCRP